jgi:hypothetical protein
MGDPILVATAALGLSLAVSAVRLIHWFIHSDPKAVVRAARWAAIGLAALSLPLLLGLLVSQQWAAAIGLAALMLLVVAWYGPRLLQQPFRLLDLDPEGRSPAAANAEHMAGGNAVMDAELAERAAAVLEEYLRRNAGAHARINGRAKTVARRGNGSSSANGHDNDSDHDEDLDLHTMSQAEALAILGLDQDAQEADIREAHRRLVQLIHPDRGGSHYLTVKLNQAKAVLLREAGDRPHPASSGPVRKASARRTQRRQHS